MSGPGAALVERVSALRPALIVIDLGAAGGQWQQGLPLLKSSPATRRIPVVCFRIAHRWRINHTAHSTRGPPILARSAFFGNLHDVIQKHARVTDFAGLKLTCQEPLSATALHGLELFNRGEYFEAHEVLESAWNEDASEGHELYRAILQVAVAYLQIERRNYNGAVKMFLRLRQWIEPLPEVCRGVEVGRLRRDARRVYERLVELGPQQIEQLERSLFTPVRYHQMGTPHN